MGIHRDLGNSIGEIELSGKKAAQTSCETWLDSKASKSQASFSLGFEFRDPCASSVSKRAPPFASWNQSPLGCSHDGGPASERALAATTNVLGRYSIVLCFVDFRPDAAGARRERPKKRLVRAGGASPQHVKLGCAVAGMIS
ncbi:hypothetical protein CIHG_02568, partial [Coccidioides immitis H538.4]